MKLLRYLIASTPAFLAFVLAPYFFLLGATYDDERLKLLSLSDAGMSPPGANAIYRGFNIWANTSLTVLIVRLMLPGLGAFILFGLLWFLSASKWKPARGLRARSILARRKGKAKLRWLMFDTGLIIAPALGAVAWAVLASLLVWLLGQMNTGVDTARIDVANLKKALPSCYRQGAVPSMYCSTVVFSNKECVTGVVVASNPDRLAILDQTGHPILKDNKSVLRFIKPRISPAAYKEQCVKEGAVAPPLIRRPVDSPTPRKRKRTLSKCSCRVRTEVSAKGPSLPS
jgi:hypothetical protein